MQNWSGGVCDVLGPTAGPAPPGTTRSRALHSTGPRKARRQGALWSKLLVQCHLPLVPPSQLPDRASLHPRGPPPCPSNRGSHMTALCPTATHSSPLPVLPPGWHRKPARPSTSDSPAQAPPSSAHFAGQLLQTSQDCPPVRLSTPPWLCSPCLLRPECLCPACQPGKPSSALQSPGQTLPPLKGPLPSPGGSSALDVGRLPQSLPF